MPTTDGLDIGPSLNDAASPIPPGASALDMATPRDATSDDAAASSCGACAAGYVCCVAPLGCAGSCVPDCRGGVCPSGLTCNETTGVCQPGATADLATGTSPARDMTMTLPPDMAMSPPGDLLLPPPNDMVKVDLREPPDMTDTNDMATRDMSASAPPDGGSSLVDMAASLDLRPLPDLAQPNDLTVGDAGSEEQRIGENDSFFYKAEARNVALSGQTIAVGFGRSTDTANHVHVYGWNATQSQWGPSSSTTYYQDIQSPGANGDGFGNAIALDSAHDRMIVGAYNTSGTTGSGSYPGYGAAYIYTLSNGTWTIDKGTLGTGELTGDSTISNFGYSVGVYDTVAAVGEPLGEPGNLVQYSDGGKVILFARNSNGGWKSPSTGGTVTASDPIASEYFGFALDMSSSKLVVGAPGGPQAWNTANSVVGRVKVYDYAAVQMGQSLTVTEEATLQPANGDTQTGENFGASVALSDAGSTALVVVGAPWYSGAGTTDSGAVYLFALSNGTWSQQAKLVAADASANALFGYSVSAVSQTEVLVGAPGIGKVYSFTLSAGVWSQDKTYTVCNYSVGALVQASGSLFVTKQPGTTPTSVAGLWVFDLDAANTGCLNLP